MRALGVAALTVVLASAQVALGVTGRGAIALPTGITVSALAVPALVAAIVAGPLSGAVVGGAFGATSLLLATTPLFQDPVIAFLPRLLIGPVAWLIYRGTRSLNEWLALALSGAAAAVVNTGGVLALAIVRRGPIGAPFLSTSVALDVARASLPSEALLAALAALATGLVVALVRRSGR